MSETDRHHLLLVEGTNFATVVTDTSDLSTARGGSLLLLQAIEQIEKKLETTAISKGASVGIFALPQKTPSEAVATREQIEGWLAGTAPRKDDAVPNVLELTPYATFIVETLARSDRFATDHEALIAKSRWRRMQAPNLAYPSEDARKVPADPSGEIAEALVCGTHSAAPAMEKQKIFKGKARYVSRNVWHRRRFGVEQKQTFYQPFLSTDLSKDGFSNAYANELEEIACLSDTDRRALGDTTQKINRLDGKIAILFADGNSFSKRRRALVKERGEAGLETWDREILRQREELLAGLLAHLHGHGPLAYRYNENGNRLLRLETLLYAGDDTLWILPAWLGIDAARLFFEQTKDWKIDDEDEAPLTHAMGLVFCHHDAPIHRVTTLAKNLAGTAKRDRQKSRLAVEVLESFDHPGTDLSTYRQNRTPAAMRPEDWLLDPAGLDAAIAAAKQLIEAGLPRRQLRRHAMAVASNAAELEDSRKALEKSFPCDEQAVTTLGSCIGEEPWRWLHFEILYDYLAATP